MANQETIYKATDRVVTITLNRPEKLNAWTPLMEQEVRTTIGEADRDDNVRVIVLTGAGRGFCAGADMSRLSGVATGGMDAERRDFLFHNPIEQRADVRADFQKKYSYLLSVGKPVIAAINGPVAGVGLVLTLYCDMRFASDGARMGTAFARRGLIAEYGAAWMLPRLIGPAHALDLLLSARMIDAAEALRMGLVNQVYPQAVFLDKVHEYARDMAANVSPRSMRIIKRQAYEAMFQTLEQAYNAATEGMLPTFESEDFKEGVAHFLEKRAAAFTGK